MCPLVVKRNWRKVVEVYYDFKDQDIKEDGVLILYDSNFHASNKCEEADIILLRKQDGVSTRDISEKANVTMLSQNRRSS